MCDSVKIRKSIGRELGIEELESNDESEIKHMIRQRVLELLDSDPGLLFSYMYRLDVLEHKIQHMLLVQKTIPPHVGLAHLIWERQKERSLLRKKYKSPPIDGWEW